MQENPCASPVVVMGKATIFNTEDSVEIVPPRGLYFSAFSKIELDDKERTNAR